MAVHRRTLTRSLTLPTFQVAEDFALPAATASFSLRFTALLSAADHFRLLALRCGTACHQRLCRHHLWQPTALDSRRFCLLSRILIFCWSDLLNTVYSGPSIVFWYLGHSKKSDLLTYLAWFCWRCPLSCNQPCSPTHRVLHSVHVMVVQGDHNWRRAKTCRAVESSLYWGVGQTKRGEVIRKKVYNLFVLSIICWDVPPSDSSVGSMIQWLVRQSLAGWISLTCPWSVVDMWPFVGCCLTKQAYSAFHPFGVGMSSISCNHIDYRGRDR